MMLSCQAKSEETASELETLIFLMSPNTDLFNATQVPEYIPKILTHFVYFDDNSFHKSLPVLPQYFVHSYSNKSNSPYAPSLTVEKHRNSRKNYGTE